MTTPVFQWLSPSQLEANSWNPNVMSQEDYEKALVSIDQFGFVDPVTVRRIGPDHYQIIDGENRWRAAIDGRMKSIPVVIIEADDDDAKALTIVLNELRGKPEQSRLATLVADLASRRPVGELERLLPFPRARLAEMVSARREAIDWERLTTPPAPTGEPKTRWVERVFRLPTEAASVVDDAIARARDGAEIETWRALELIAADFLSGN